MQTLYVYADGSDNAATEAVLVQAFGQLVDKWENIGASAVNQQHERTEDLRPEDLPDWQIGLNIPLNQFGPTQVAELVPFASALAQATDREFVVGIASSSGIADDLIFLGSKAGQRECHELLQHLIAV